MHAPRRQSTCNRYATRRAGRQNTVPLIHNPASAVASSRACKHAPYSASSRARKHAPYSASSRACKHAPYSARGRQKVPTAFLPSANCASIVPRNAHNFPFPTKDRGKTRRTPATQVLQQLFVRSSIRTPVPMLCNPPGLTLNPWVRIPLGHLLDLHQQRRVTRSRHQADGRQSHVGVLVPAELKQPRHRVHAAESGKHGSQLFADLGVRIEQLAGQLDVHGPETATHQLGLRCGRHPSVAGAQTPHQFHRLGSLQLWHLGRL